MNLAVERYCSKVYKERGARFIDVVKAVKIDRYCQEERAGRFGMFPHNFGPLGPSGFDFARHRQTLRPTVDRTRSKALRPFGLQ